MRLKKVRDPEGLLADVGVVLHAATEVVTGKQAPSAEFYTKLLKLNLLEEDPDEVVRLEVEAREEQDVQETRSEMRESTGEVDVEKLPPKLRKVYEEVQSGGTKKFCTQCGMPMTGGTCQECAIEGANHG